MAKYSAEDIRMLYQWAPDAIKSALFSPETSEYYDKITSEHGFSKDQRAELSKQTGLLLLGVLQPTSYVRALADNLKLPREKAAAVAQGINRDLFNPIKDALKSVHEIGSMRAASATPSPYVTPSGAAPVAPPPEPIDPELARNILEQKLSSAFRIKSDRTNYSTIPKAAAPTPKLVVPPPPASTIPNAPAIPASSPQGGRVIPTVPLPPAPKAPSGSGTPRSVPHKPG